MVVFTSIRQSEAGYKLSVLIYIMTALPLYDEVLYSSFGQYIIMTVKCGYGILGNSDGQLY